MSLIKRIPAALGAIAGTLREQFARLAEAGIIVDGSGMRIHPAAPFGGVKASQIGPPEHGLWDRHFFSSVRVLYRDGETG